MVFKGRGFTSGGQKSVSGFSAAAWKIPGSKCYIESLPLVVKDKKKLLLSRWKVRCIAASSSCVCPPEVGQLIDIWKPSIVGHNIDRCIVLRDCSNSDYPMQVQWEVYRKAVCCWSRTTGLLMRSKQCACLLDWDLNLIITTQILTSYITYIH